MSDKCLLVVLCMIVCGFGVVSAETIPFYQCVEILGADVDLGGNNISIIGTGTFRTTANISNFEKLYIRGTDSSNICRATCIGGGCFV